MNIHHRNLQKLVSEIFNIKNGLSPKPMNDVFKFVENSHFLSKRIRRTKNGLEKPSYLGPNLVPNEYKTNESLADFKTKTKT